MEFSKSWALRVLLLSCCLALLINNGIIVQGSHDVFAELQYVPAVNVKQVHRTGYHFQPTKHWIKDSNGPMYFSGICHLFYQYNPKGAVWIKPDNNPLIVADQSVNKTSFRDPTTAWLGRDGHWRIIIGSRRKHRGISLLYRSKDFTHWAKAKHPLHSTAGTGNWECPNFFPVLVSGGLDTSALGPNVKHVSKVSLDETRHEYYTLGIGGPLRG